MLPLGERHTDRVRVGGTHRLKVGNRRADHLHHEYVLRSQVAHFVKEDRRGVPQEDAAIENVGNLLRVLAVQDSAYLLKLCARHRCVSPPVLPRLRRACPSSRAAPVACASVAAFFASGPSLSAFWGSAVCSPPAHRTRNHRPESGAKLCPVTTPVPAMRGRSADKATSFAASLRKKAVSSTESPSRITSLIAASLPLPLLPPLPRSPRWSPRRLLLLLWRRRACPVCAL